MILYPELASLFFLLLPVAYIMYRNFQLGRKEFGRLKGGSNVRNLFDVFTIKWFFSGLFYLLALFFIILSLVGIKSEEKVVQDVPSEMDVVFALDISRSMLSTDVSPNRLNRSLTFISSVTSRLDNARFGLVVFKGQGMIYVPVTEDIEALDQALTSVSPDIFSSQSTNLRSGISTAMTAFPRGEERRKILILITDGENHLGNTGELIDELKREEIEMDVLAVGTEEGGRIPIGEDQYLRDSEGRVVVSKLNRSILSRIAESADGNYCDLSDRGSLNDVFSCLSIQADNDTLRLKEEGMYRLFLLLAVLALFLSLLVKVVPWRGTY